VPNGPWVVVITVPVVVPVAEAAAAREMGAIPAPAAIKVSAIERFVPFSLGKRKYNVTS
jgi:hypothetical protein